MVLIEIVMGIKTVSEAIVERCLGMQSDKKQSMQVGSGFEINGALNLVSFDRFGCQSIGLEIEC